MYIKYAIINLQFSKLGNTCDKRIIIQFEIELSELKHTRTNDWYDGIHFKNIQS